MSESKWRSVGAQETIEFAAGKTVASMEIDEYDEFGTITRFTDGTAVRVQWERGREWSEHTSDPDAVYIYVQDKA